MLRCEEENAHVLSFCGSVELEFVGPFLMIVYPDEDVFVFMYWNFAESKSLHYLKDAKDMKIKVFESKDDAVAAFNKMRLLLQL